MATTQTSLFERAGALCQTSAAMLIAGVWRRPGFPEIDARLSALPRPRRVAVIGGVLGLLFLMSLFAAQFGWIGMLVFWLGVILLVR